MPKLIFAKSLEDEQRVSLERIMTSDDDALKQRALIILLSSEERYRVPEIAPIVGLHEDKVRKWISRFNLQGLPGLQPVRRKPGPRGKFSDADRSQILSIASTPPRQLGQLRSSWTLDSLREYLIANGVITEISRESLRQILLQANVDWQRLSPPAPQTSRWLKHWNVANYS
ncbi:MAG: helix-turn-helix domain-containing protein [Chloroflexota bacterium]|nr:helix-turn-helix domain-containing protein [Chloroflexota bacterium]